MVVKQTESDMVAAIEAIEDRDVRDALKCLLQHGHDKGHHSAPGTVGMSYWYAIDGTPTSTWAMWPKQQPMPVISLSIGSLHHKNSERAVAFVEALRQEPALAPYLSQLSPQAMNKYPSVPVAGVLTQPGVLQHLLGAIEAELLTATAATDGAPAAASHGDPAFR